MTGLRDPSTRLFASVATATAATTSSSSVGSSVRRTSPIDLNLGTGSDDVPPIDSSSFVTHEMPITRPLFDDLNGKVQFSAQPDLLAEQVDKEELGALRLLASELHAALRLSEEENLLLKGMFIFLLFQQLYHLFMFEYSLNQHTKPKRNNALKIYL